MSVTSGDERATEDERPLDAVDTPAAPEHTPLWRALAGVLQKLENASRRVGSVNLRAPILIIGVLVTIVLGAMALAPGDTTVDWRGGETSWPALQKQAEDFLDPLDAVADLDVQLTLSVTANNELRVEVVETIDIDADFSGVLERVVPTRVGPNDVNPTLLEVAVNGERRVQSFEPIEDSYLAWTPIELVTGTSTVTLAYTLDNVAFVDGDEMVLSWNVFGAAWPTNVGDVDVTIVAPKDIAGRVVSAPVLSDTENKWWSQPFLTEVRESATTYEVRAPHTDGEGILEARMGFEATAFSAPRTASGAIVFALLPMVPLLLLGVVFLFAIAARRIAWGDARGRGWIVPHSDPPPIAAYVAARWWGNPQTIAVADALQSRTEQDDPKDQLRIARRAKRIVRDNERPVSTDGMMAGHLIRKHHLTRSRTGVVLDSFIMATLVLVAAQLAVLRQMALRTAVIPGWWMVITSVLTIVAAIAIAVLIFGRKPLSREGALYREYVEGIELYIDKTQMRSRVTAADPLLPYVAMFSDRDEARELLDRVFPDIQAAEPTRPRQPVSRLHWAWVALIIPIAMVVLASNGGPVFLEQARDVYASSDATETNAISVDATLKHDAGDLVLAVSEELTVHVTEQNKYGLPTVGLEYSTVAGWNQWETTIVGVWVDAEPAQFRATTGETSIGVEVEFDAAVGDTVIVRIDSVTHNPQQTVAAGETVAAHVIWDAMMPLHHSSQDVLDDGFVGKSRLTVAPDVVPLIAGANQPTTATADGALVMSMATDDVFNEHPYDLTLDSSMVSDQDRADHAWRTATTSGVMALLIGGGVALFAAALLANVMARRVRSRWPGQLATVLIVAAVVWILLCIALFIVFINRGYYAAFDAIGGVAAANIATIVIAVVALVRNGKHLRPPERPRSVRWQQWGSD